MRSRTRSPGSDWPVAGCAGRVAAHRGLSGPRSTLAASLLVAARHVAAVLAMVALGAGPVGGQGVASARGSHGRSVAHVPGETGLVVPSGIGQAPRTFTLIQAVESALRSHPAAEGARARTEGATARLDQARAAWLPFVGADGALARFQEPMVVAPLHGFDPLNPPEFDRTLLQGNLSLGYTLFDGGARGARIRRAEAGEAGARAGEDGTGMELAFQVSEAYLAVLTATEVLEASSRQRGALEAERHRVQQFLAEGKAARVHLLRVEAALSRTRAGEISAGAELDVARGRLGRLTGLAGEEVRVAELVPLRLSGRGEPDFGGALEVARSRSPVLSRSREEVAASSAGVREAESAWFPRVEAGARYSDYGTLTGAHTLEWQGTLQVSYPLFTGGARGAEAQRAKAEARGARENLRLAEIQVEESVELALAAVKETRALREAFEAAVGQSEEVARIESLALEAGAGVQTDFLQAEAELLQARAGLARARHGEILARVRLAMAMGELTLDWLHQNLEVAP
jgi:outer membrane protein TolC